MSKAISGLPLADTLTGYELLPVVQDGNTVQSTVAQMATLVGNTTTWGYIQGTLSNQTDLQTALNLKVSYTGATGNVDLGEYGISAGYFQADLTPTGTLQVGRMMWNSQDGTMDLRLLGNNVTLHIGQKQVIRVVNKTGATLTGSDYQVVKISGAQGQRPKVALAQANNDANSADTIGLVNETILDNQEGFVCTSGTITNINTTGSMQGETWADGDVLYLSGTTAGRLTNVKPQAPIHTVIVGFVIHAHATQGKIYVKVDNGYELDELHNVRITSPSNGQVLTYNNGLWENQTNGSGTVTSVAASAGTGISVSGSPITSSGTLTITNTAPDQVVSLTAGSNINVTGTYPNFTIAGTNSGTVTSVAATAGTGISVSGSPITSSGTFTITNTAPDQVVSLTAGSNVTITGTYPNFTIAASGGGGGGSGTVTDVSVVSANGFSGSVANSTTTPAITLSTSISGLLKGSSGALAAASASDVPDLPQSKITNLVTDLAAKAPLASPALTGTPTAPTAVVGTDTTQIATTAFVNAEIANDAPSKTGTGASGTWGISVTGNAGTATTLATARTLTIGSTGKTFDGSANVSWTLGEIGAQGTLTLTTTGTSGASTLVGNTLNIPNYAGTVTSVGLSLPSFITVTNSPVTSSGTLTGTLASQTANRVFAAPNGSAGAPTFRALVEADIPTLSQAKITSLTTDLAAKAPLASPALTGTPTAPTASVGTNTTQIATTAFVNAEISNDTVLLTTNQTVGGNKTFSGTTALASGSTIDGAVIGYRDVPVTIQNATYSFALADAGKAFGKDNSTAYTYTIPANSSVAFPVGTVITVFNNNATSNITVAITTDTLRLAGTTTTGSRTVAPFSLCTLFKVSSTVWMASGAGVT